MEIYPKCPIIKEQCGRREPHVEALTCDETVKIVELGACLQRHMYIKILLQDFSTWINLVFCWQVLGHGLVNYWRILLYLFFLFIFIFLSLPKTKSKSESQNRVMSYNIQFWYNVLFLDLLIYDFINVIFGTLQVAINHNTSKLFYHIKFPSKVAEAQRRVFQCPRFLLSKAKTLKCAYISLTTRKKFSYSINMHHQQ